MIHLKKILKKKKYYKFQQSESLLQGTAGGWNFLEEVMELQVFWKVPSTHLGLYLFQEASLLFTHSSQQFSLNTYIYLQFYVS